MKTKNDPRHKRRSQIVNDLFSLSFHKQPTVNAKTKEIVLHLADIDRLITKNAPEWPIDKISKVDLAILRLGAYELTVEKKEPPKAIIDEAVELAKELGTDKSPGFVNGVLGTIYRWTQTTSNQ